MKGMYWALCAGVNLALAGFNLGSLLTALRLAAPWWGQILLVMVSQVGLAVVGFWMLGVELRTASSQANQTQGAIDDD